MSEKSGIQMLEEICEQVMLLSKRFAVIEQNTKELLGRANGHFKPESKPTITSIGIESAEQKSIPSGLTTKVIGKIKNSEGKLVSGVKVKISNAQGNTIKETKTNRAGEFMCFLPPGTYKTEYFLENIINASLNFNINKDEKVVRLAQPTPVGTT
jgi:hypothetical protein